MALNNCRALECDKHIVAFFCWFRRESATTSLGLNRTAMLPAVLVWNIQVPILGHNKLSVT